MTEPQIAATSAPADESIVVLDEVEQESTATELSVEVVSDEEDQSDLDDLDEIEFLLDEIEDQIAPLAL